MMPRNTPSLTFARELDHERLTKLFADAYSEVWDSFAPAIFARAQR
jgi:hypothetical protein